MIYDLAVQPITHDFLFWLMRVEEIRSTTGIEKIPIEFRLSESGSFRERTTRDFQLSDERKFWRLHNLLVPLAWRLPSVESVSVIPAGGRDAIKIDIFKNAFKNPLAPLRASEAAKAAINALYPERFVTFSERNSDVQPLRNSNNEQWQKVCTYLQQKGYRVVVVPDTEAYMQGRGGMYWDDVCPIAAINVDLRLALYELSQFSLFTSGGPFNLGVWDDRVNYAVFKLYCDGIQTCSKEFLTKLGIEDGSNKGTYRQHWWGDDNADFVISTIEPYLQIDKRAMPAQVMDIQTHFRGRKIIC